MKDSKREVIEIILSISPKTSREALELAYDYGHLHGQSKGTADAIKIVKEVFDGK